MRDATNTKVDNLTRPMESGKDSKQLHESTCATRPGSDVTL